LSTSLVYLSLLVGVSYWLMPRHAIVCKCKEFGELGIINLRGFNTTLLFKWWWKLLDEPAWKWASLLSHSYRLRSEWWADKFINEASSSPFWEGLRDVKDIFFFGVVMDIKTGRGTKFWSNKWCSNVPFSLLFPELFAVAEDPNGLVLSLWSGIRRTLSFSSYLMRVLLINGKSLFISFWGELVPNECDKEQPIWEWGSQASFLG